MEFLWGFSFWYNSQMVILKDQLKTLLKNPLGTLLMSSSGFNPLTLSPSLWLDASDSSTITESGGDVSQWDDKSLNGRNVSQGLGGNQPNTGVTTIGGLNTITFNGTTDYLHNSSPFMYDAGTCTIFCVQNTPAVGTLDSIICEAKDSSANTAYMPYSTGVALDDYSGVFVRTDGGTLQIIGTVNQTLHEGNDHISLIIDQGNQFDVYADGGSKLSSATFTRTGLTPDNFALGVYKRSTPANFCNCNIGEILIFSSVLSSTDINLVGNYLANKWSISWSDVA